MASTLLALLATKGGKAVSRRVLELDSEDANGHLRCRSVEYVGLGRGQHDRDFPLHFTVYFLGGVGRYGNGNRSCQTVNGHPIRTTHFSISEAASVPRHGADDMHLVATFRTPWTTTEAASGCAPVRLEATTNWQSLSPEEWPACWPPGRPWRT